METDHPVVVRGLNHWFGTGEARKQALFTVDLVLPRGSFTSSDAFGKSRTAPSACSGTNCGRRNRIS